MKYGSAYAAVSGSKRQLSARGPAGRVEAESADQVGGFRLGLWVVDGESRVLQWSQRCYSFIDELRTRLLRISLDGISSRNTEPLPEPETHADPPAPAPQQP
ncbi:hypothetical protein IHE56_02655 [Streptomyces sp. ID01-12c]|uniref:hypothetical protein n=1 Tax=Streptomyces caniscabiei TaxID=2746961 RepID=UPI001781E7A8|nr:hypothetical protein [Streptomyces caniscabiei]MBD9701007.1 hypothetical protein [Streptomyces caniscabiei]MDX3732522.1 hypothetical protein [Streptomyces caniscabiei]